MSWKPSHIQGMLEFVAEIAVKVCGVGLGLGAGGRIAGRSSV